MGAAPGGQGGLRGISHARRGALVAALEPPAGRREQLREACLLLLRGRVCGDDDHSGRAAA